MVESLSNLTSSWWMRWQIWVCCLTNPSMWWQICVWCVTNPSETHCVSLTSLSTHVQGGLVPQRANSSAPIVSTPPACTSCCTSCCWCRPTCTFPLVTCSPRCIEARNRVAQNFLGISLVEPAWLWVRLRYEIEKGLRAVYTWWERWREAFEHKNVVSLPQFIFHVFYPVDKHCITIS